MSRSMLQRVAIIEPNQATANGTDAGAPVATAPIKPSPEPTTITRNRSA